MAVTVVGRWRRALGLSNPQIIGTLPVAVMGRWTGGSGGSDGGGDDDCQICLMRWTGGRGGGCGLRRWWQTRGRRWWRWCVLAGERAATAEVLAAAEDLSEKRLSE